MSDRRADNKAADWAHGDATLQTCGTCDAEDHAANLYHSSAGFRAWSTTTYRRNEVSTVLVQRACRNHFRCGARSVSLKVTF